MKRVQCYSHACAFCIYSELCSELLYLRQSVEDTVQEHIQLGLRGRCLLLLLVVGSAERQEVQRCLQLALTRKQSRVFTVPQVAS